MAKVTKATPQYPPSREDIVAALGIQDVKSLSKVEQTAFNIDCKLYPPLRKPSSRNGDWLISHQETGQRFKQWEKSNFKAVPHATYRTIYVQPVGEFTSKRCPALEKLLTFTRAFFFGLDVEFCKTVSLESVESKLTRRVNQSTGRRQYLTGSLLKLLTSLKPTRDSRKDLCSVVITMEDVYPKEEWNFVYGIANLVDSQGVWSFSRFDPEFPDLPDSEPSPGVKALILRRSVKVLAHELTHIFGLRHCIYFTCLMNGANHEEEMDHQPLFLCPVCLRKLYECFGKFDIVARYKAIYLACKELGLQTETKWYADMLKELSCDVNELKDDFSTFMSQASKPSTTSDKSSTSTGSSDAKDAPTKQETKADDSNGTTSDEDSSEFATKKQTSTGAGTSKGGKGKEKKA